MSDNILTDTQDFKYTEAATDCQYDEFKKVISSRRSVRVFSDRDIDMDLIDQAIDDALMAPSSSNLQPWKFFIVSKHEKRSKFDEACLGQNAAKTAQSLIICVARLNNWRTIQKQMIELLKEQQAPKAAMTYYKKIVPLAYDQGLLGIKGLLKRLAIKFIGLNKPVPRGPKSYADMRVWAHKSCALACENLMLSLRASGLDSCPMEGMDENRILALLPSDEIAKGDEVCMILGVGQRSESGVYGPQIRMPREQFVVKL